MAISWCGRHLALLQVPKVSWFSPPHNGLRQYNTDQHVQPRAHTLVYLGPKRLGVCLVTRSTNHQICRQKIGAVDKKQNLHVCYGFSFHLPNLRYEERGIKLPWVATWGVALKVWNYVCNVTVPSNAQNATSKKWNCTTCWANHSSSDIVTSQTMPFIWAHALFTPPSFLRPPTTFFIHGDNQSHQDDPYICARYISCAYNGP